MKKCIIPGSFDPVTAGHTELFREASKLFDEVYPTLLVNTEKGGGMFSYDERMELLESTVNALKDEGYCNITPVKYSGLTSDCAAELSAYYIVKGVRNGSDFDYEYGLSEIMRRFDPRLSTVLIPSKPKYSCVSSTYVRELIKFGKLDSPDLAPGSADLIKKIMSNR